MRILQMPEFSVRLKELRKEKGITQKKMAVFLGCTEAHYQQIEYGNVNIPSLTLVKLADYFGVTTDYMLGKSDVRHSI